MQRAADQREAVMRTLTVNRASTTARRRGAQAWAEMTLKTWPAVSDSALNRSCFSTRVYRYSCHLPSSVDIWHRKVLTALCAVNCFFIPRG
jgi:hypothetical protein